MKIIFFHGPYLRGSASLRNNERSGKGQAMCPNIRFFLVFLSILTIPGCIGGVVSYPVECQSAYPLKYYVYRKDAWGPIGNFVDINPSGNPLTKADFLRDWGKPDEVTSISANTELWVYNRSRFCGITPIYIVPVPLGLPICDEFDHITFENDRAIRIHFRRVTDAGLAVFMLFAGGIFGPTPCPAEFAPSEKEIWLLPSDPSIISIPHTESCRGLIFKDGIIWWTDGRTAAGIDPVSLKTLDKPPVVDHKPPVFDRAAGFAARWQVTGSKRKPSLTRTDWVTGEVVAVIPLDRPAIRVMAGENAVWVLHEKSLSHIDPQANKVTAVIPVDFPMLGLVGKIAVVGDAVWISAGLTLARIDPLTNQIAETFQIVPDADLPPNYYSILEIASEGDTVWVLFSKSSNKFFDAGYTRIGLAEFDTRTDTLRSTRFLGSGHSLDTISGLSIALTEDAVWACLPLGIYVVPKTSMPQSLKHPGRSSAETEGFPGSN
ncbi:MAG TPA: hypothetical protein ENN79_00525 [Desulfobacteraceae bacterium]|nr:hypothetical protein [Desulfobacteraceae bacterium]